VARALAPTALTPFVHRPLATLSGRERQRTWIALALAQTLTVVLLDEPTTHLDLGYPWEVMKILERLNRQHGVTIASALHDLQQAAKLANRLVVLKEGQVIAPGPPHDVLTPELITWAFGVRVRKTAVVPPSPRCDGASAVPPKPGADNRAIAPIGCA
jgi:iron complex transport system ATP-binding protein